MTSLPLNRIAVIVKRGNRHPHTNEHLTELHERNDDWVEPLGSHFNSHEEVIPVHYRMDGVVHHNEKEARGGGISVRKPAVEEDGNVMIPMQKDERLLMDDNEECVEQFGEFTQNKELNPKAGGSRPIQRCGIIAQVAPEGVCRYIVIQLRSRAERSDE
mmetsp:Transcript_21401/g.46478  ORF Transcript_21401/g.46478 Transcript_21401/m.46478 type:complete len:159 (-) Transcript_21401:428-904(-)